MANNGSKRKSRTIESILNYIAPKARISGTFIFEERCRAFLGTDIYELVLGCIKTDWGKKVYVWGLPDMRYYDGCSVDAVLDRRFATKRLYVDTEPKKRYAVFEPLKSENLEGVVEYFDHQNRRLNTVHLS